MIHEIKCLDEYFEDQISGIKTFEVRRNDRNYKVGDYLAINEVTAEEIYEDSVDFIATGRSALFYIGYILDNKDYCKDGYVVLGIEPCLVKVSDRITDLTIIKRLKNE